MLRIIDKYGKRKQLEQQQPSTVAPTPSSGEWVMNEVPAGAVNGSNATFTTAFSFVPGKVKVQVNGIDQKNPGDFTTSGTNVINMNVSPLSIDTITTDYIKL